MINTRQFVLLSSIAGSSACSAGTADPETGLPNFAFGVRLDWHASFLRRVLRDHLSELPPETE